MWVLPASMTIYATWAHVDATLGLCVLSGDKAKHHVQVAHREEEKQ